jgi:hypothetical protein
MNGQMNRKKINDDNNLNIDEILIYVVRFCFHTIG